MIRNGNEKSAKRLNAEEKRVVGVSNDALHSPIHTHTHTHTHTYIHTYIHTYKN